MVALFATVRQHFTTVAGELSEMLEYIERRLSVWRSFETRHRARCVSGGVKLMISSSVSGARLLIGDAGNAFAGAIWPGRGEGAPG
jgi:hypothetical protein